MDREEKQKKKGRRKNAESFPVVAVGASAGGLEAFRELLQNLPERPGMAFVLIQHLDPTHASMLTEILTPSVGFPINEARNGIRLQPDHVYVIPANADMVLRGTILQITRRPASRTRSTPIDDFLVSLAENLKSRAIGVILSGLSSDGVRGLETIKAEGGITFAQDEKSARFPDLPRNAAMAGCVDFVMPPKAIAVELSRIGRHPYVVKSLSFELLEGHDPGRNGMDSVLAAVRNAKDVDFTRYKRATVARRVARRMALLRADRFPEYLKHLQKHPEEVDALYEDLLIKVSAFFRDPASFAALRTKVLPALLKKDGHKQPVRVWVPGCATGEEAYSIAISIMEFLGQQRMTFPVQIFATDLSERAVEKARAGIYPDSIAADISPERLRRFFTKIDRGYQVAKPIRDMCVMARQNLIKDPPFSRLDLISCRNVLIYLEPALHRRLFNVFHYALRPGGFLMLGASETIGNHGQFFQLLDRKGRIYTRRQTAIQAHFEPTMSPEYERSRPEEPPKAKPPSREGDVQREADRLILKKYSPPGVVITEDFEILQFRGDVAPYLRPAAGRASLNLLKMVTEGLLFEVREAIQKAKGGEASRSSPVKLRASKVTPAVRVRVLPLSKAEPPDRQFLVLFEAESGPGAPPAAPSPEKPPKRDRDLDRMQEELSATKEHLQSIIEDQEATNEELKSANEEVLSSNEELQSTNEELETAKEELQSTNEELTTLNEELQTRNAELNQVNSDITNLLTSVSIAVVMVGNDLRIRRFTPMAEKVLNLIPTDVGRPITDIKPNIDAPDLGHLVLKSLEDVNVVETEVRDRQYHWYTMRIKPYRTLDNKIDGAVIVLLDIDLLKRATEKLERSRSFSGAVWDSMRASLVLLDRELRIRRATASFYEMFRTSQAETAGKSLFEIDGGAWNVPRLRERLELVESSGETIQDVDASLHIPRLRPGRVRFRFDARKVQPEESKDPMILLVVSERPQGA
jgi:two-component system, chemotaxis family, CheB/CheR fusion protein